MSPHSILVLPVTKLGSSISPTCDTASSRAIVGPVGKRAWQPRGQERGPRSWWLREFERG